MGAHLRVRVPLRAGHSEQSEAQLRDGDRAWGRSRQQLEMLVMTEQKIRQLQAEVAMMQTARQAYASGLKATLVTKRAATLGELIE
jgi:hypothetical protein